MKVYSDYLRWLYAGGRPNRFARAQNRVSALAFSAGVLPHRTATLQVRGRRSGNTVSLPVVLAEYEGERYLVSMLGKDANWVRNVEAAEGWAELRHGHHEIVRLVEVDPGDRPPILKRYLELAPGARPHVPVSRSAPVEAFASIAADYPVYEVVSVPFLDPSAVGRPARRD
jgi:hypothetical protein